MKTHWNLEELQARGWNDYNLHLLNDYWQHMLIAPGTYEWRVATHHVIRHEKLADFIRHKPKSKVKGMFDS